VVVFVAQPGLKLLEVLLALPGSAWTAGVHHPLPPKLNF
jgi:hypothetical protein